MHPGTALALGLHGDPESGAGRRSVAQARPLLGAFRAGPPGREGMARWPAETVGGGVASLPPVAFSFAYFVFSPNNTY